MSDSTKRSLNDDHHGYVDLTSPFSNDEYICEQCGIRLALFPQAQTINPHAGISYICPQCHNITDTSLAGMQREDKIKPLDIAVPTFVIVPEQKGSELLFKDVQQTDHDPEPQEEELLKAQGATIISKKVEAHNDFG